MTGADKKKSINTTTVDAKLGSDTPQSNPKFDAFGYAPFARAVAHSICTTRNPHGMVMSIDGQWGSGKSTFLNFVKHYVQHTPRATPPPTIVEFNPWWFTDREQLAAQFLAQFQSHFPQGNKTLLKIGEAMAAYSDSIGKVVSNSVGGGIPYLGPALSWVLKKFGREKKDVQRLKAEISAALSAAEQRFLVIVDDIDRLAPDEIREVFKVIKALADFPNVIYLLAFDRALVAEALQSSLGIKDGTAYLEKIVQVPFTLPSVSHDQLVGKLIDDLNREFGEMGDGAVSSTYWGNVFHDGLSPLIQKPRDILRIINALSVTFPAVRGEVNTVDFLAIEFLRVFAPFAYSVVRDNAEKFTGISEGRNEERQEEREYHNGWLALLPRSQQVPVKALLERIFPRLQSVWGNLYFDGNQVREWNAAARICSPNMFPTYFQFGPTDGSLSRTELRAFIALGGDAHSVQAAYEEALTVLRPDGSSKALELHSRIIELDDLGEVFSNAFLSAVFQIGDRFLANASNRSPGFFAIPGSIQMYWLIHHLAKQLAEQDREERFLQHVIDAGGEAIATVADITASIYAMHQPEAKVRDSVFQQFQPATVDEMKRVALTRLQDAAIAGNLMALPEFRSLLHYWLEWDQPATVQNWVAGVIADDALLPQFIGHFLNEGSRHSAGDRVSKKIVSMNPREFEPYLLPPFDLFALDTRVQQLVEQDQAIGSTEPIREFQRGMALIRRGANPDRVARMMSDDD